MSYIFEALQRSEAERKAKQTQGQAETQEKTPGSAAPDTIGEKSDFLKVLGSLSTDLPRAIAQGASTPQAEFRKLPFSRPSEEKRLACVTAPTGLAAEKFRLLATRLKNMQHDRPLKRVLITSSICEEGKSMVSANLAITLARHGLQKVLLIDGDLRKPVLAEKFGFPRLAGLHELLRGQAQLNDVIYELGDLHVSFLPAGAVAEQPLELLQSSRLPQLLAEVSGRFDWILIDSPPLFPVADANVWNRHVDGLLLVAREGRTEKKVLKKGLENLDNPVLLGAVVNGASNSDHKSYYKRYSPPEFVKNSGKEETKSV